MDRHSAWVLTLVLTCAPAVVAFSPDGQGRVEKPQGFGREGRGDTSERAPGKPDNGERRKWWLYNRAELGITDQQAAEINNIFEATISKLRESRQELERAEEELSRTIREHKADVATISMLVDRVESARSQNTKMRVLMLYRMHLILTPDQRAKLEALRARQDSGRKDKTPTPGHRYP
jgi:Spy/CpxP family protein refolding chaperone